MGRVCQGAHGVYVMPDVSRNPEQAVPIENQDQPVTIRPATVADQVALAELNAVVQQMHHDIAPEWFKPPELAAAIDFFREALRSEALRTFVAEIDGVVRGYALARLQQRPETALTDGGLVVELDQISVDPAYRGRGLGRQLIDQVRSLATDVGASHMPLTVWDFNRRAREVFERAGFAATCTRMVTNDKASGTRPAVGDAAVPQRRRRLGDSRSPLALCPAPCTGAGLLRRHRGANAERPGVLFRRL